MEPTDLTIKILQEIRDNTARGFSELREEMRRTNDRLEQFQIQTSERFDMVDERFVIVETALRDMAEQLVIHSRGIRTLIETREKTEDRLERLDARVTALELSE